MVRFRSKLGIFASGSHTMFKDVAKANAMRNQPFTFHQVERKLTAYSGGSSRGMCSCSSTLLVNNMNFPGSTTHTWGDIKSPMCAANGKQFWISLTGPSIFDVEAHSPTPEETLGDEHFFEDENAEPNAADDEECN